MTPSWTSVLWFVAILAAIPVVLWLLKRSPMLAGGGVPGTPRAIATLPISASQRLVTVEVGEGAGRTWLVLGVSPQGIRTLHTMAALGGAAAPDASPGSDAGPSTAAPVSQFSALLDHLRGTTGRKR